MKPVAQLFSRWLAHRGSGAEESATCVFTNALRGVRQDGNVLYFADADAFCLADLGISRKIGSDDAVALTDPVYALLR